MNERGITLTELIIATAISSVVIFAAQEVMVRSALAENSIANANDLLTMKTLLRESIDCDTIFAAALPSPIDPANPGASCNNTSASVTGSPWLRLYTKSQSGASLALGTYNIGTGVHKVGKWSLRAACSAAEQSIVVQAAQFEPSGNAKKDAFFGDAKTLDWTTIIGGDVATGELPISL